MSKTEETKILEKSLWKRCEYLRIYGCDEVTIGFANGGLGNERADFVTMDSKGVIKCYEIKVSLNDLRSNAKKSWYGHYNYLVVSRGLYQIYDRWKELVPAGVGILVGPQLESVKKASKQSLSPELESMMLRSLIRTLFYKYNKSYNASDISRQTELKKKVDLLEKENFERLKELREIKIIVRTYEKSYSYNHGLPDFSLKEEAEKEQEIYFQKNPSVKMEKNQDSL